MTKSDSDRLIQRKNAHAKNSSPIDTFIGSRIRHRRIVSGLSEQEFADLLGIKSQKVQRYESGTSRVGAISLFEISCMLKMPISYSFFGMPRETPETPATGLAEPILDAAGPRAYSNITTGDALDNRETMELVYAFHSISKDLRRLTLDLMKSLAGPEDTH